MYGKKWQFVPVFQEAVVSDPVGFVRRLPERCILDEIQHTTGILGILKQEVNRNRAPGRFILTGSAQVLLSPDFR
ncbi:MAG: hypothetical protein GXO70_02180 [Acidobacteria bacterium]|nr:hypothetical protein [Acidobacteriota bacterium]